MKLSHIEIPGDLSPLRSFTDKQNATAHHHSGMESNKDKLHWSVRLSGTGRDSAPWGAAWRRSGCPEQELS